MPKREYYMVSPRGNRLFTLNLDKVALAFCGASTPDDHRLMDQLLADQGAQESFGVRWLDAKGHSDAAGLLHEAELDDEEDQHSFEDEPMLEELSYA